MRAHADQYVAADDTLTRRTDVHRQNELSPVSTAASSRHAGFPADARGRPVVVSSPFLHAHGDFCVTGYLPSRGSNGCRRRAAMPDDVVQTPVEFGDISPPQRRQWIVRSCGPSHFVRSLPANAGMHRFVPTEYTRLPRPGGLVATRQPIEDTCAYQKPTSRSGWRFQVP